MAAVLEEMASQGKDFDATALHDQGVEGLDSLLDQLLWQAPEFEGYTGRFVASYEAHLNESERYADAFHVYVMEIGDDARLTLLAKRIRRSLKDHGPGRLNERGAIWRSSIRAIVQHGKDKYPNLLEPLLDHPNEHVAADIVRTTANYSSKDYYPELQLAALGSKRKPVVREALKWAPICWDKSRRPALKKKLVGVFEDRDEDLKFAAAFPLLHGFGYPPAIDYLIEQTKSDDKQRTETVLGWFGDKSNFPDGPPADLAARLSHLRESDENHARRPHLRPPRGSRTCASRTMKKFARKPKASYASCRICGLQILV